MNLQDCSTEHFTIQDNRALGPFSHNPTQSHSYITDCIADKTNKHSYKNKGGCDQPVVDARLSMRQALACH